MTDLGVRVLSPADPTVVEARGEFLFVASDHVRSVRLVEDRHLESIRASNFLWLVAPDGYVGQSASMELGFAVANDIPIFATTRPSDLTLRQYVRIVPNLRFAVESAASWTPSGAGSGEHFLINPHDSIKVAYQTLGKIERAFAKPPKDINDEVAREVYSDRDQLAEVLLGCSKIRR